MRCCVSCIQFVVVVFIFGSVFAYVYICFYANFLILKMSFLCMSDNRQLVVVYFVFIT